MKLKIDRAARPDNTGGYDYAVSDENNHIIAEFFEHVGKDRDGNYMKMPAREYAELFLKAMEGK
jgi:hypothetical protein